MFTRQIVDVTRVLCHIRPEKESIKSLDRTDRKLIHQAARRFQLLQRIDHKNNIDSFHQYRYQFTVIPGDEDPQIARLKESLGRDPIQSKSNLFMRILKAVGNFFGFRISSSEVERDIHLLRGLNSKVVMSYIPELLSELPDEVKNTVRSFIDLPEGQEFTEEALSRFAAIMVSPAKKQAEYLTEIMRCSCRFALKKNDNSDWKMDQAFQDEAIQALEKILQKGEQ